MTPWEAAFHGVAIGAILAWVVAVLADSRPVMRLRMRLSIPIGALFIKVARLASQTDDPPVWTLVVGRMLGCSAAWLCGMTPEAWVKALCKVFKADDPDD